MFRLIRLTLLIGSTRPNPLANLFTNPDGMK